MQNIQAGAKSKQQTASTSEKAATHSWTPSSIRCWRYRASYSMFYWPNPCGYSNTHRESLMCSIPPYYPPGTTVSFPYWNPGPDGTVGWSTCSRCTNTFAATIPFFLSVVVSLGKLFLLWFFVGFHFCLLYHFSFLLLVQRERLHLL